MLQRHAAPYPRFILLLRFVSLDQILGLRCPAITSLLHHQHSQGQCPEDEDVIVPSNGCKAEARGQAITIGVAAFSGDSATHAASPHHISSRCESVPTTATSKTPSSMLLKEDAFALVSCTVYHRADVLSSC